MGSLWGIHFGKRQCNLLINNNQNNNQTLLTIWTKIGYQQILLHGLYDFIEMEIALDLVCAKSTTITQILISIIIAVTYTLFSAFWAWYQYKKLNTISNINNNQQFVSINNQ